MSRPAPSHRIQHRTTAMWVVDEPFVTLKTGEALGSPPNFVAQREEATAFFRKEAEVKARAWGLSHADYRITEE